MNNVGQWFSEDSLFCRKRIRHFINLRRRQRDIFGKCARRSPEAQQPPRVAQILRPRKASLAMAAAHQWICYHAPAISKTAYQLMAENHRWPPQCAVPQKSRNVGAAHSRYLDRDFFFSFLRLRPGALL